MNHRFLLVLPLSLLLGFSIPPAIIPDLKKITDTPCVGMVRTYSVLKNHPDSLYGEISETYQGIEITHGFYYNNLPDGKWTFRESDNTIEREINFDRGKLNGFYVRFFPNGDTLSTSFYNEGNTEGVKKSFYKNGKPRDYQTYSDGKLTGKSTYWYDNGQIREFYNYSNGQKNSEYKIYSNTGILLEEGQYINGNMNGLVNQYYPSEQLRLSLEYKNGNKWSLVNQFNKNGKINKKSGNLKDGNGTLNTYNNDHILTSSEIFSNGLLEGVAKEYDEDGKLSSIAEYHNGLKSGKLSTYYKNELIREDFYVNDTLNGHTIYYTNKKITHEGDYKSGKKVPGTWKIYTAYGFIREDVLEKPVSKEYYFSFPDGDFKPGGSEEFTFAEEMPDFLGELGLFSNYLKQNIKYPAAAKNSGIMGTVYISFTVNKLGFVEGAEVVKGASPDLDKEALRVIREMPRWKPAYMDGVPVRMRMTQPVRFILK